MNIGIGHHTLQQSSGSSNIAIGDNAMNQNTSGLNNTAIGAAAMWSNTTGAGNTAIGLETLLTNSVGHGNTAVGTRALTGNTAGNNTAVGSAALQGNTTGSSNVAVGTRALTNNITGFNNIAMGSEALSGVFIGSRNVGIGSSVMGTENAGDAYDNVIIGHNAAFISAGTGAVVIGSNAGSVSNITTNVLIGHNASTPTPGGNNIIAIGAFATGGSANSITLGNNQITQLRCQVTTITALSDRRVKEDLEFADIDRCLADVKRLPVSRYKYKDFTGTHLDTHVTGFLAEDVEKVFPKSVTTNTEQFPLYDTDGKPSTETVEGADGETYEQPIMMTIEDVKSITMTEAVPTLWGAVQALLARVEYLESRVK